MRHFAAISLVFLGGCSISKTYPALGSTGGAAIGSVGGPGAAAGGALLGWGVGKAAQINSENKDLINKVEALSRGDIDKLIGEESIRVWSYVKLLLWGIVLWNLIPICYTIFVHRKHKEAVNGKNKESS
jgi:hypothetical protein